MEIKKIERMIVEFPKGVSLITQAFTEHVVREKCYLVCSKMSSKEGARFYGGNCELRFSPTDFILERAKTGRKSTYQVQLMEMA